jgi:glycosyltransferase involved in cell wall biosynthesis
VYTVRILFVLPYVPSPIRVRPYQFVRELSRRHEVTVLATGPSRELDAADGLSQLVRTVEVVPLRLMASLRSCAAAVVHGEPLQAAVCQSPELERRLGQLLAAGCFDLVHVEHLRAAHLGARVPKDVPTLFDAVDCISLLLLRTLRSSHSVRQRLLALLELRRMRTYEAHLLGRFDRVTVTSPEDGQALSALASVAEVAVVPNGVDLERFQPLDQTAEPATLVFSGKMSYHANVTGALHFVHHMLPLIRAIRPDVRLKIVGSNPPRVVRELARRDPAISVTGYVPDLRLAVRGATVAICPVTVKVGIQNKVLEAMAMRLPVVATRQGVEGLQAAPGRDLLVADSPAEFAAHVCRLLGQPHLRQQVAHAGLEYVRRHHRWEVSAAKLETLYGEAIKRHHAISR